jgi:S1-C subfamily serine protease
MLDQALTSAASPRSRLYRHSLARVWAAVPALVVLLALLLAGCGGSADRSSSPAANTPTDLQQNVITVINKVQPSVVEIESRGQQGSAIGSGEILNTNGYIVTNDHVVRGFTAFQVRLGKNQILPAQLTGQDAQDDLAVLKITASHLQPIALADSSKVQVGQFDVAVGNPLGLAETATFGIVSALNRTAGEGPNGPAAELTGLIQTSAPINPGNSGGALVDLNGQLMGIPTLAAVDPTIGAPANGIGFAIPSNRVKFVTQQLIQHGRLIHTGQGFLGIQGQDVTPQLAAATGLAVQSGVVITGFANDAAGQSPAKQAGLQMGDVIVAIDGQAIASSGDIAGITLNDQPGTQVQVKAVRGPQQITRQVKLGERPVGS